MPAPLAVNREAIKTLVLAIGCTATSKQTGIPLNTILSWSARGKWLQPVPAPLPPTVQPIAINAISAPAALKNELAENKQHTRIGLSKYMRKAADKLVQTGGDLRMTRPAKDIADMLGKVWPEQSSGSGGLNLQLLTGQVAIQYNTGSASQD